MAPVHAQAPHHQKGSPETCFDALFNAFWGSGRPLRPCIRALCPGQARDMARSSAMGVLCKIAPRFTNYSIFETSEHQITHHLVSYSLQIQLDMFFERYSYDYVIMYSCSLSGVCPGLWRGGTQACLLNMGIPMGIAMGRSDHSARHY